MAVSTALRQVVTCSGAYADGSLRVVRNGVGLSEHARVEIPGVKEMWALHSPSRKHPCLAVSFVAGTHFLTALADDELSEADTPTPSKFNPSSLQDLTFSLADRGIRIRPKSVIPALCLPSVRFHSGPSGPRRGSSNTLT